MRILVTGEKGQLGSELRRIVAKGRSEVGPIAEVWQGAELEGVDLDRMDISQWDSVQAWFAAHDPYDLVVNCAAMTNVDGCETAEDVAFAANAVGPYNLARACAEQGATLVHVSTDYVFPGTEESLRVETDPCAPASAYGRTKLAGEGLALTNNPRTHVVRTAWLYGYEGRNFVKTMLALGEKHERVTVVNDQLGNPTSANDLAHQILAIAASDDFGIWHCTNEGVCSWADFAEAIMQGAGLACEVVRCTSDEYAEAHPGTARRPHFSALQNAHLEATIGNQMRPWQDALASYLENLS